MPKSASTKRDRKKAPVTGFADLVVSEDFIAQQKSKDWPALSAQHRAFAEEYLVNGYNHRAAAAAAGFPENSAIGLLRKPIIRAYITSIQERFLGYNIVNLDFIDSKLDELLEIAMGQVDAFMVDKDGTEYQARKFQGQLALEIIREKSKMHGITKPDVGAEDILAAFAGVVRGNLPKPVSKPD